MIQKTYYGHRSPDRNVVNILVEDKEKKVIDDRPLPHVEHHSPDGFEWGYGGSGPADLALSILADHFYPEFGKVMQEHINMGAHPAVKLHQDFKWMFVAHFSPSWQLHKEAIDNWLKTDDMKPALEEAKQDFIDVQYLKKLDQMVDEA